MKSQKNKQIVEEKAKVFHNSTVRPMFQDEVGFRHINKPKYCWCKKEVRPSVPCHRIREYRYVYGAVEPISGESCRKPDRNKIIYEIKQVTQN